MSTLFPEPETLSQLASRENRLLTALDEVIRRRGWNVQERREHQFRTLHALLVYAYEEIPLYREKYSAAGFHPAQVRSLDDLARIPFLTKEELRRCGPAQLRSAQRRAPAWLIRSSGSTGVPSRLYRSEDAFWNYTACDMALYYQWCRGRPIDECLYFLSLKPGTIDHVLADMLRATVPAARILSECEPASVLIAAIDEFLPEFISSYPSTMRHVAIEMKRRRRAYDRLRLLHMTSETLDRRTRNLLTEIFPRAKVVETYASSEGGLMAYRCPEGAMHVAEDNAIVEIVDSSGYATADCGEIVVTDLTNWATPMIRYRGLGDYSRWGARACSCGAWGRNLADLEGRSAEAIFRLDGTWLWPLALTNALDEIEGVLQYQVVQRAVKRFEVRIVRDLDVHASQNEIGRSVRRGMLDVLDPDVECEIQFCERIRPRENGHKVPLVVSLRERRP